MNAIETLDAKKLTIGHAALGLRNDAQGSVKQQVHDGDTIVVRAVGNIGVRLLGIDTPELSFRLPGEERFRWLSEPEWDEFLRDPFADRYPAFDPPLSPGLRRHLEARVGPGTAENHFRHAQAAKDALQREVELDLMELDADADSFRFFMAFAYEVMDAYGRFLCYINREQPHPLQPVKRPPTYNDRMLNSGHAVPYFIWPNVNPFRKQDSVLQAVPKPGKARTLAYADTTLRIARENVARSRANHQGVFSAMDPLSLEPFELRLLARREPPNRWVIDLDRNDDVLIPPQDYHTVPHPEDRLFVPAEFVPLFVERGWKKG